MPQGIVGLSDPVVCVISVQNAHNHEVFALFSDGTGRFSKNYSEGEAFRTFRDAFAPMTGTSNYFTFQFEDTKGGLLVKSLKQGTVSFGPKVKDQRLISLFRRLAEYNPACECGADKCRLPFHSSWCPKAC